MKTKLVLGIIFYFSVTQNIFSQTLEWAFKIGGTYVDFVNDMSWDQTGNIYLTGGFCNQVNFNPNGTPKIHLANGLNSSDIFLAKYDSDFNLKWVLPIGGNSSEMGTKIEIDKLSNVFVIGEAIGIIDLDPSLDTFQLDCSNTKSFIAKYDSSGSFITANVIPKNYYTPTSNLYVDVNDNVYTYSNDTFTKFDNNLNIIWSEPLSGQPQMDNNGIYKVINKFGGVIAFTSYDQRDITLKKYDNNTNIILTKELARTTGFVNGGFIKNIFDGNYIISGIYWGELSFYSSNDTLKIKNFEMQVAPRGPLYPKEHEFIACFDSLDNVIWAKSYIVPLSKTKIVESDNNKNIYTLGGLSKEANFDPDGKAIITNFGNAGFIAKYDNSFRYSGAIPLLSGQNVIGDFKTYNKVALLCGFFNQKLDLDLTDSTYLLSAGQYYDIFVAKYSDFNLGAIPVGTDELNGHSFLAKAYPNPSNGQFNIYLEKITNDTYYTLLDSNGKIIQENKIDSNLFQFNLENYTPGIYYLLVNQGSEKSTIKLIMSKY